jgi:GDPmannose 4,6-dehydratase
MVRARARFFARAYDTPIDCLVILLEPRNLWRGVLSERRVAPLVDGARPDPAPSAGMSLGTLADCLGRRLHSMSPADFQSVAQVIEDLAPDEIYNLSGQSSVSLSFTQPAEALRDIALGTLNMLETLRCVGGKVRFYNAGSPECFGDTEREGANEQTAFRPKSPYGVAKAAAISLVANYRESHGLLACSDILFNHESPLRPPRFVTRKGYGQGEALLLCVGRPQ